MKKIVKRHIGYFVLICLFYSIIILLDTTCIIKYFLKIPCPTCGVTRALVSILKLDFSASVNYHPLAVPLVISVLLAIHIRLFKKKLFPLLFICTTLLLNLILYIHVLFTFFA